jgi:predicted DNA-binding transcriptional regulator AlpA
MPPTPRSFDPTDPSTWRPVLRIREVAAIYGMKPQTIQHYLKPSSTVVFTPAPYRRHPALWRKSAILRDVRPEAA